MTQHYTVQQLADLAHVSARTLHYYDQIGLLQPAEIGDNGYRYYGAAEVRRLQHILLFKELDFPLDQIQQLIDQPNFNVQQAYRDHYQMMQLKRERLDRLMVTLSQMINQEDSTMTDSKVFDDLTAQQLDEYKAEARQRWGQTDAYQQSVERTKHWSKADYAQIKEQNEAWCQRMAQLIDRPVDDPEVQVMVAEHRSGINKFYDCTDEIYRGLAEMYVVDPRFKSHYDRFNPHLAVFLSQAMLTSLK